MQASKLTLAEATHPSQVVKVWLDPNSESLALMLSDSSCLLYSLKSPSSTATQIPAPTSDACFLRLIKPRPANRPKKAAGAVVFISAMPDRAGSRTVLKAWLVRQSSASNPGSSSGFSRASIEVRASKGSEGLAKLGILELVHGFSVKIAASVNVLSLYSPSEGKIWVMAAKLKDEQGTSKLKGEGLEPRNLVCISLIKCCVVDCNGPVYSIRLSLQHMLLGQDNGVRVWPLRPLVKGKQKKTVHDSVSMYERSVDEVSMNGGRVGDLDQSNSQLTSAEIVTKSIKSETKATELQVEVVLKKVDSVRDDTILSSGRCNGGEMAVADILKGVDVSKACKKEINGSASADRPKNSLVRGLDDGERGPDVKGHPRNGVIRSVNGSVVLKNNGEIWSNSAGARCNGETLGVLHQESIQRGILASGGKGSVDAIANWVDGIRCNCTNSKVAYTGLVQGTEAFSNMHSNGTTERGIEVGNLVNSSLHECEAKLLASKRRNGQICQGRPALDEWYAQQQLSQLSYMSLSSSSASSSLSGPLAPLSVSGSASASSSSNFPSVMGSNQPIEGTIYSPVSSLPTKSRSSLKVRDTSGKGSSFFVPFKDANREGDMSSQQLRRPLRAVSIHSLSQTRFVVLDSMGDIHILSLHNLVSIGDGQKEQDRDVAVDSCLRHLKCPMKVNMLAVFPEVSSFASQKLWVSDGRHSIHLLSFPEVDASHCEADKDLADKKSLQLSVDQAMFLSEPVRAISAMSVNATLVLTQGSITAYSLAGS